MSISRDEGRHQEEQEKYWRHGEFEDGEAGGEVRNQLANQKIRLTANESRMETCRYCSP